MDSQVSYDFDIQFAVVVLGIKLLQVIMAVATAAQWVDPATGVGTLVVLEVAPAILLQGRMETEVGV